MLVALLLLPALVLAVHQGQDSGQFDIGRSGSGSGEYVIPPPTCGAPPTCDAGETCKNCRSDCPLCDVNILSVEVVPSAMGYNSPFNVRCTTNLAPLDCIWLDTCGDNSAYTGFDGWSGSTAVHKCTSDSIEGTFNAGCRIQSGTPDDCIAKPAVYAAYTVNSSILPPTTTTTSTTTTSTTTTTLPDVCNDGICGFSETNANCPQDCPRTSCGNPPTCNFGETCDNCPHDCGVCQGAECGNNVCQLGETNANCPQDCTIITCGDRTCDATETTSSCPSDCGTSGGFIAIDIEYDFVENGVVPIIPTGGQCTNLRGCPNYTKTMPVKFTVYGSIRTTLPERCTDAKCDAFYTFENGPRTAMQWDAFSQGFFGTVQTSTAQCNRYHTITVTMTAGSAGGAASQKIYISCDERITLNPAERRLAVGEKNKIAFFIDIWNPTNAQKTYNIEIAPPPESSFVSSWLRFDCGSVTPCTVNNNMLSLTVPAVSSKEAFVYLTNEASSRAGVYPVSFVDAGNNLQGRATMLVFAEGLSEFASSQIFALLLGALALLALI